MKYWLHRISHEAKVSYPLLESGYLSIGWSDMAYDKDFLAVLDEPDSDKARKAFNDVYQSIWGELGRARYSLWRFLFEFQPGNCVLIPTWWGTFSLYKITSAPITAALLKLDGLTDWDKNPLTFRDNGFYSGEKRIDLGFFRQIEPIANAQKLSRDAYACAALTYRMKMRQTNANISSLAKEIEKVIEAAKAGEKPSMYGTVIEMMRDTLFDAMRNKLNSDKMERLVKWYLCKCGADNVKILPKKEREKKEGADADVTATFETLKIILYIQVKHHTETTSEWAIKQVAKYKEQKEQKDDVEEYHYLAWVVSTCDQFSEEAVRLAGISRVRLIDGKIFAQMLIDKGIQNLDEAF